MKPVSGQRTARVAAAMLLPLMMTAAPGSAADAAGRYTMQQTDNGMLRLDTLTGAMSLCNARNGAWACARIEDDSAGLESELRDLKRENRSLRNRIAQLQTGSGDLPTKGAAGVGGISELPSEQDVDRAFTFLEGIIRRFKGLAEELQQNKPNGTPL